VARARERAERARREAADREAAEIEELRRVDAWLDRPEWLSYWDDDAGDFRVPGGWPPDSERALAKADGPARESESEPASVTFMHRMLESAIKGRTSA
jgi:hypothetical protein